MTPLLRQRVKEISRSLSRPTDSSVIHLQTLRMAIGWVAVALPFALALGENLRDRLLAYGAEGDRVLIETSISAYYHTGMRDVFVGSLCSIAVFLLCYKGYERRDDLAANVAGLCVLLVALFPTLEASRESGDTGAPVPDSLTLFSGVFAPDPRLVGWIHFGAAAAFFVTLAVMSLALFTRSGEMPTPEKKQRNRVYVACGITILVALAAIALGKLLLDAGWERRTSYVFWLEAVAVVAFGLSWLTKAEVILADRAPRLAAPSEREPHPPLATR